MSPPDRNKGNNLNRCPVFYLGFGWYKTHNTDTDSLNTHHTTQLAALVSAAGTFLVAALLTSEDKLFWNRIRSEKAVKVGRW